MKPAKTISLLLVSLGFISACASLNPDSVQVEDVTVISEETITTGIDAVRLWKRKNGTVVLTGRVIQTGYGRLIPGHIDVQFISRSGDSMRQYLANLRPGRKITKIRKVGYFDTDLGALDVAGGTAKLKYHDSPHEDPFRMSKEG